MRTLCLLDSSAVSKQPRVIAALNRIKSDYSALFACTFDFKLHDYTNVPWGLYDGTNKGLGFAYMREIADKIYKEHNLEFDNIIFCIDPVNWQAPAIGGWNIGGKTGNYYAQIVKISDSDDWLYKIFAMEIAHMWDDSTWHELSISLNTLSGLDFDYDIVHGEHKDWGVPASWSSAGYFTDYNYSKLISTFGTYIKASMEKRKKTYDNFVQNLKQQISLAEQVITLLKALLALRAKPKPVLISELEGQRSEHHH